MDTAYISTAVGALIVALLSALTRYLEKRSTSLKHIALSFPDGSTVALSRTEVTKVNGEVDLKSRGYSIQVRSVQLECDCRPDEFMIQATDGSVYFVKVDSLIDQTALCGISCLHPFDEDTDPITVLKYLRDKRSLKRTK